MNSRFHVNVFFSKEDGGYIDDVPDLKYCSAFGQTPLKALKQVLIAKDLWIASAKADGKRVPKPRYRPAIYQIAS